MSTPEDYASRINTDFKTKDARFFTGTIGKEATWPRVLAFCDRDIPLTFDRFEEADNISKDKKSVAVNFTVVDCIGAGFTKVPYANDGTKTVVDKAAKPLSKMVKYDALGDDFSAINCWPWTIVMGAPKDKDDCKEDGGLPWEILPGMVLRFTVWRDSMRGTPDPTKYKASMCPEGLESIPAFTILELELAVKGWSQFTENEEVMMPNGKVKVITKKEVSPVAKQYGMGLNAMRLTKGSLYSCVDKLARVLPSTCSENEGVQKLYAEKYPSIAQVVQCNQVPFMLKDISVESFFDVNEENGLVKLSQWSLGVEDSIDIRVADVLTFTNSSTLGEGCALLELACGAGCLSVLCVHNRFRRDRKAEDPVFSVYYGVPLIDTVKLLSCIGVPEGGELAECAKDPRYFIFEAGFKLCAADDDKEFTPKVLVSKDPLYTPKGSDPPSTPIQTNDLVLGGKQCPPGKGYFVKFVNAGGDPLWQGYFNMSKPSIMMGGSCGNVLSGEGGRLVRKRWAADAVKESFDPFGVTKVSATLVKKLKLPVEEGGSSTGSPPSRVLATRADQDDDDAHSQGSQQEVEETPVPSVPNPVRREKKHKHRKLEGP